MSARALSAAILAALAACGDPAGPPGPPGLTGTGADGPGPAAVVHAAVVAGAVAALEAALAGSDPAGPDAAAQEAAREPVAQLVEALSASSERDSMRRVLLEELVQLGDAAVPHLAALLADRAVEPAPRQVAAEALGALDSSAATGALLDKIETSRTEVEPENWLIAQCAWRLSETGADWILPRVLLCMRYEKDHETVLWLASAATRFGNYSGLEGLRVIMASDSEVRARAAGLYAELVQRGGTEDPAETQSRWDAGADDARFRHAPSPRLQLETWRRIAALSEWQLRGVDDARFVLSRSGPYAAELLAQALLDEDVYVRVHSAQCLERMGGRGRAAAPALIRSLADPSVAPASAAALGACAAGPEERALGTRALLECLGARRPLELRVAAARALGAIQSAGTPGASEADAALSALVEDGDAVVDLRVAAAGALVRTAPLDEAEASARLLRELLRSKAVEVSEVEAALGDWLARREDRADLLDAWRELQGAPRDERLASRSELIDAALE